MPGKPEDNSTGEIEINPEMIDAIFFVLRNSGWVDWNAPPSALRELAQDILDELLTRVPLSLSKPLGARTSGS